MFKQDAPFSLQIELTEGCNLYCKFCGIRGIRKRAGDYKFMTISTAKEIVNKLKATDWNSRIEFAMHGEPTLNPDMMKIIRIFRKVIPTCQMMLLTNGITLSKSIGKINKMFDSGLNIIGIDDYGTRAVSKLKNKYKGFQYPYPDKNMSPHMRVKSTDKLLIYIGDIRENKRGGHSTIVNHCGAARPMLKVPIMKRCAKPFRELSIRWDGNIALCCNDFRGQFKIANIHDFDSIEDIWNCKRFQSARRFLYDANRCFFPCSICDATSYRVGLLPDKQGKKSMKSPSKKDSEIVRKAIEGEAYCGIIKRSWEINPKKSLKSFFNNED